MITSYYNRSIFSRHPDTGRTTSGPVPGGNICTQRSRAANQKAGRSEIVLNHRLPLN